MGYHATFAWRVGRVILWGQDLGVAYTDPTTCGNITNWHCHFLSPSSCTLAHAAARNDTIYTYTTYNELNPRTDFSSIETENYYDYIHGDVLSLVRAARLDFKNDELKYWWRAQVRPSHV